MNVLLTGATGFLGSCLTRTLLERGHSVSAYRRMHTPLSRLQDIADRITWHPLEPAHLRDPFAENRKPDAVIHLATAYGRNNEAASSLAEANIVLPLRIFEEAQNAGTPVFINTDSFFTGQHPHYSHLLRYSLTKHHFVEWLRQLAGAVTVYNFRLEQLYGPDDHEAKFVPWIVRQCLKNVPGIKLTAGDQMRDFIFVDDAISAFLLVLESNPGPEKTFVEFQLGSGSPISIRDFVERVHSATKSTSSLHFGALPHRYGEQMFSKADTTALAALGWQPRVSLSEGLEKVIAATFR